VSLRIGMYHCRLLEPGVKPGGVQIFVDRLATALTERGHEVTFFTFSTNSAARPYPIVPIRPRSGATSRVVRHFVAPWLFNARPFSAGRFDVVHLHGDDWFYLRRRVPTVRTFYGSALMEALSATSVKRRVSQLAIFALEQLAGRVADASYGIGFDSELLYPSDGLLRCGAPPVPGPPTPAERPTILFIGTWEGRKRGRWLHEVFQREVRPAVPDAELWLVSDRAQPGEGATWLGAPSDAELAERMRQAWAFCLPSTYEGFGLPYLEAMAFGVPVIATRNPGAVDLLADGRAGEIVKDDELGRALIRVLTDAEHRERLRAAGWERAAAFTWDALIADYETAYQLAIERFAARRAGRR
jgi:phosphatidylinositol alpha-mannosyltransferase